MCEHHTCDTHQLIVSDLGELHTLYKAFQKNGPILRVKVQSNLS